MICCEEMIDIWMDKFKASGLTIDEEIDDVKGTIENEWLWRNGSDSQDEMEMHEMNIANLEEYLERLEEMKKGD